MANYSNPWGTNDTERRNPTTDEYDKGFQCGVADNHLFNGLLFALQSEINAVLTAGGITPSDSDFTQLYQAIDALISAATGGTPAGYILESQARTRLPIYPQTISTDGVLNVSSPATGTVRVPSGVSFLHRGIGLETTTQEDFATTASKTYHVRWLYGTGYSLNDLADSGYNPSVLAETDTSFDSTFDDILFARVTTNSSNVATITNLANLARLTLVNNVAGTNFTKSGINQASCQLSQTLNWARTPTTQSFYLVNGGNTGTVNDKDVAVYDYSSNGNLIGEVGGPTSLSSYPVTRYNSQFRYMWDFMETCRMVFNFAA